MSCRRRNRALVLEYMEKFRTFDPEQYYPYLAEEPTYRAGMNTYQGREAFKNNTDAGKLLYPEPENATNETLAVLADGDWVSVLLIRRAKTNKVDDYENIYAMFFEVRRRPHPDPGRDARLPGLDRQVRPVRPRPLTGAPVATTIGNIAINVSDLERSERFYVDVIGLEVLARIETPDVREVLLGSSDGGSQLMLARHTDQEGPVDTGRRDVEGVPRHRRLRGPATNEPLAAGAADVAPPKHLEAYKVTIAFVHDPDGHLLEFGQRHL